MLYTDPGMLFPCKSNLGKVVKKETLLYERVMTPFSASVCAVSLIMRQITLWIKNFLYHTQGTHQTDNYNSKFSNFLKIFNYWFKVPIDRVRSVSYKNSTFSFVVIL